MIESSHISDGVFDLILGHWYRCRDGKVVKYFNHYAAACAPHTEHTMHRCDFSSNGEPSEYPNMRTTICTGRTLNCNHREHAQDIVEYLGESYDLSNK